MMLSRAIGGAANREGRSFAMSPRNHLHLGFRLCGRLCLSWGSFSVKSKGAEGLVRPQILAQRTLRGYHQNINRLRSKYLCKSFALVVTAVDLDSSLGPFDDAHQ